MSEIKQIQIAGEAAAALIPSGGKRRTTRKKTSLTVSESRSDGGYSGSYSHASQDNVKAVSLQNQYNNPSNPTEPIYKREDPPTTIHINNSYQPVKEELEQQHLDNIAYSSYNIVGGRQQSVPKQQQNIVLGPKKKTGPKLILSRKKKHGFSQQQHQQHQQQQQQ